MIDSANAIEPADSQSYFVPMVDMLAGIIFILIIMLASVSLVSRSDLSVAAESQQEIKSIRAELEKARLLDSRYLDPRRTAETAIRLLLIRLQAGLKERGFESSSLPEEGRLIIRDEGELSGPTLSPVRSGLAEALARVLSEELPCISEGVQLTTVICDAYPKARLDTVAFSSRAAGEAALDVSNAARIALSVLAEAAHFNPGLLSLRAPGGSQLVTYRGLLPGKFDEGRKTLFGSFELQVQMDIPAMPK